ncbi:MAG: hypothetical protein WKF77_28570 [Planctomycetaceae bacterium]
MLNRRWHFPSVFLIALVLGTASIAAQRQESTPEQVVATTSGDLANAELPRTNLQIPSTHGGFFAFAFAPDGETVAGGTGVLKVIAAIAHKIKSGVVSMLANSDVRAWDTATGKEAWSLVDSQVRTASVSADGKSLALFQAKFVDLAEGLNGSVKFQLTDQRLSVLDAASGKSRKSIYDRWPRRSFLDDGKRIGGTDHLAVELESVIRPKAHTIPLGPNALIVHDPRHFRRRQNARQSGHRLCRTH